MTLDQLNINEEAIIQSIPQNHPLYHQLICLGFVPPSTIKLLKRTPFHNPLLFYLHSYVIALRIDDAKMIEITQ